MISTRTQKRIMWIPLVSYLNLFFYTYNCRSLEIGTRAWWMSFVYSFGYFGIGSLFYVGLLPMIPPESPMVTVYIWFLLPLVVSYGMIKFQVKYLNC